MGCQQQAPSSSEESWPFSWWLTQMQAVNNCKLFFPHSHVFSSLHLTPLCRVQPPSQLTCSNKGSNARFCCLPWFQAKELLPYVLRQQHGVSSSPKTSYCTRQSNILKSHAFFIVVGFLPSLKNKKILHNHLSPISSFSSRISLPCGN